MPAPPRPTCPGCGVALTPGYPRCPKCHHALPTSVRMARTDGGGATGLASEDAADRGLRWPWYLAGLALLGLAVALVASGLRDERPAVELPDDPELVEPGPEPVVTDEPATPPPVPTSRPDPTPIADRLARLMAGVRLYATVEAVDEVVEIRTGFCDDPRIGELLGEVAVDLKQAGVVSARCRAPHGAEQWSRPLP